MASTPSRLTSDNQEQLRVTGTGGSGGNVNITGINGVAPALSNPLAVELSDGTNAFGTPGNPLTVNVASGGGSNASVGVTGAAAPASATEIGVVDGTGKLQPITGLVLTNAKAAAVAIVDSNGNQISSFGGGTQYADGVTQPTPTGTVALGKNPSNVLHALALDASGNLNVNVQVGGGGGASTPIGSSPTSGTLSLALTPAGIAQALQIDAQNALRVVVNNTNPIEHWIVDPDSESPAKVSDDGSLFVRLQEIDDGFVLPAIISQWGAPDGVQLSQPIASAPIGNEVAPVIRPIQRRAGGILTNQVTPSTTTIWPGATTTPGPSNWFDVTLTGANWVEIWTQGVGGATPSTFFLDQADNPADVVAGSGTNTGVAQLSLNNNLSGNFEGRVSKRYWRLRVAASATISQFTAGYLESLIPPTGVYNPSTGAQVLDGAQVPDTTIPIVGPMGINVDVNGSIRAGPLATMLAFGVGAGGSTLSYARTPNTFKTAQATAAGITPIWTPTAARKFRLMRYQLQVTDNAALSNGGVVTVTFFDAATNLNISHDFYIPPAPSGGSAYQSPWIDLGNGILSAVANNVLGAQLSTALVNGNLRINTAGTEE